ncbi:multidrug ABC transporter [Ameyamaea chiangmaiensis NBRC 103196]|uniref:Bcr/CflA family efflux transporter n=1 Tax=Ameyamaea chiangmaiensis TaxID=442969 RepID=A0A850PBF9_9PROT|nr:multidrug effflux MFS transporter [Ameyamaea chiangmaiensis]MBS4075061.1 multidrug effflux MFS transporter [Ameyamaea chiangmaiensis]NVN41857.1 multidrug effflux MFS transporter [Ameyamaea chiangmaiensis]GBQ65611.1 multidrug ABC transporter [Ameyamaea chiangmaiensis NBRC 103196]
MSASLFPVTPPPPRLSFLIVALLGLISAIGPLSTDMYLPAFPWIERDLGAGEGSAQFTLVAWFLGLAVGQFSQGPISDRWGRRAPLVAGLAVFTIASVGCATVTNYHLFCVCRFIAACGGSASAVIPRAVVRDVATGREGARMMAQLTLVFGVMPVLAPSLGSAVLVFGNWRWIFWFAVAYGIAGMAVTTFVLPDTLPPDLRRTLSPRAILWRYISIIQEPVFITNGLIASFSTFVMFAYIGSAPVVFEKLLGFSPRAFGVFFGINAAAFILGTQINARFVRQLGPALLLERALIWALCAASLFVAFAFSGLAGQAHPLLICAFITSITGALGFIGTNATVLSFTHHGSQAGSASALLGTMQFSIGALSNVLVGLMPQNSALPTAVGMGAGVGAMALANLLRRRAPSLPADLQ